MRVHYSLFNCGTWHSHREAGDRRAVFDFCCDGEDNPVHTALSTLAAMLLDPEGAGRRPLALLFLKYGDQFAEWPRHVHVYLEGSLSIAMRCLWRKAWYSFKQFPWLLAPAFDMRRSELERRATLQKFLDAKVCCLDPGLCAPLRVHTSNIDDYVGGTVLQDFLATLFERVVVTSTQVELLFASLSKFTYQGAGLPTLAAKYMLNSFKQAVELWRENQTCSDRTFRSNRSRAPWVFTAAKGRNTNHLHILAQELKTKGLWPGGSHWSVGQAMSWLKAQFGENHQKSRNDYELKPEPRVTSLNVCLRH